MNLLDRLADLRLVVVTGKGGVGKSTITAALGFALARRGRRALLLEIDPRENLHHLLDVPPTGGTFERVLEGLYVQNLSPVAVLDELVRERVPVAMLAERLLKSTIYRHFVDAAPGLKEVAALGHALRVVRGLAGDAAPDVDLVVLDAPATGHGVSLLEAPKLVGEVIRDGPFAQMGRELAAFVADADATGIVVAAAAEELPAQEALELLESLDARLGRRPELLVINALYPERGARDAESSPDTATELWIRRRRINDRELERLRSRWRGPRVELPLVPLDRGVSLARTLSQVLEGELEAAGAWR